MDQKEMKHRTERLTRASSFNTHDEALLKKKAKDARRVVFRSMFKKAKP